MGTLTTNLELNKPTIGGDSGGEAGTDAGGWPEQINENFDTIDAAIKALQDEVVVFPENLCVVLDRSVSVVSVSGTTLPQTLYIREINETELVGRAIRVEMLGIANGAASGRYFTFSFYFGGVALWQGRVPFDTAEHAPRPFYLSVKLIPHNSNTVSLLGVIGIGGDGSTGLGVNAIGNPYGSVGPFSVIGANQVTPIDITTAQELDIQVTPSDTGLLIDKVICTLIRE